MTDAIIEREIAPAPADHSESVQFKESLKGRVRNLALSANTQGNALIPVFEAISNSLHSIQERFDKEWTKKGQIVVTVFPDEHGDPYSFKIEDNGTGLTDSNLKSFLVFDSDHKINKGGKGVGRLTWLKAFNGAKVDSIFFRDGNKYRRTFDFVLNDESALSNYRVQEVSHSEEQRTSVFLDKYLDSYKAHCPKKTQAIAKKIIGHFLPALLSEGCPSIIVEDLEEKFDLQDMLKKHQHNPQVVDLNVEGVCTLKIQNLMLDKAFIEGPAEQRVYFSAHGRIVREHIVSNQVGLTTAFDYNGKAVAYVGIVSGDYLDARVTQERNYFDIDLETWKKLTEATENSAVEYLANPIAEKLAIKSEKVERLVKSNPRFKYLVTDNEAFAKKLPLNAHKEEEIYRALALEDFRETKRIQEKVDTALSTSAETLSVQTETLQALINRITDQGRSSLAEYIARRKAIIEILDKRLGFENSETETKYKEEAVHGVICPLKVTSGDVEYGAHNLWLLDDRLAYYDFWSSDLAIKKFAKTSDSLERPDIVLFEGCSLLQRERTNQPVVIVEFKRPARTEYQDDDDPIKQIYGYIKELREKKISDRTGKLITSITDETPFFCYVVCDVTAKMREFLENAQMDNPLPGGRGFYGYNPKLRAYVETIEYSKLVEDARLRHEAFFKELGIS